MSKGTTGRLCILAIGAHAGDMEITAGGLIAKYAERGDRVVLVHALRPSGAWARPPNLTVEEYSAQRTKQAFEVGEALGVEKVIFLGYKEGIPVDHEEMRLEICDLVRELRPDLVLTHWKGSYHSDHIMTHLNVTEGLAYAQSDSVRRKESPHKVRAVFHPENWEDPQGFVPEAYVDTSRTFKRCIEAISMYDFTSGKYSGFNYIDYYSSLSRIRGMEAKFDRAEAFMAPDDWAAKRQHFQFLPL
jgi:LmbE family N-acetylglucosaminyl deacetylase